MFYKSDDLDSTMRQYNQQYRLLSAEGLPSALGTYQDVVCSPSGKAFAAFFLWASPDVAIGQVWLKKVCALAPLSTYTVTTSTLPEFLNMAGSQVPDRSYGSMITFNTRSITPAVASVLYTHAMKIPPNSFSLFGVHELRGPATEGRHPESVFPLRQPHCMLEIFVSAESQADLAETYRIVRELRRAVMDVDPDILLPGKYLPFAPSDMSAREVFGEKYQALAGLKQIYDPQNLFNLALPRM